MLLEALVACAGVTLRAVATSLGVEVRGGSVRGRRATSTSAARSASTARRRSASARSGSRSRSTATPTREQLATLLKLTERYCVVLQTLARSPQLSAELAPAGA